jgi:hypothetical protein
VTKEFAYTRREAEALIGIAAALLKAAPRPPCLSRLRTVRAIAARPVPSLRGPWLIEKSRPDMTTTPDQGPVAQGWDAGQRWTLARSSR